MVSKEEVKAVVEDLKFKDVPKKEKKESSGLTYKIPGLDQINEELFGKKPEKKDNKRRNNDVKG